MQYQFHAPHEIERMKQTRDACELIEPLLTQLRLLLFIGEHAYFDHTEFFMFDHAVEPVGGYAIEPLPFTKKLFCDLTPLDIKRQWFAHVVAWLLRGLALQKQPDRERVDAYVAYGAYQIARAIEDLRGVKLCKPAASFDAIKQQLVHNVSELYQLLQTLAPLEPIRVSMQVLRPQIVPRVETAIEMAWRTLRSLFVANAGTISVDEPAPELEVQLSACRSSITYCLLYDSYFRAFPNEHDEFECRLLSRELGIFSDVRLLAGPRLT